MLEGGKVGGFSLKSCRWLVARRWAKAILAPVSLQQWLTFSVGLVFASAAILKTLALRSNDGAALSTTSLLPITLIELELLLAVWLLWGITPRWSLMTAAVAFSLFAGVSGAKLLSRVADCGCWGILKVGPEISLSLDLVLLAACLFGLWHGKTGVTTTKTAVATN